MGVLSDNAIIGASAAGESYQIEKSCRFYHGYLSKTFSGAGNLDKWTISVWMKNNGGNTSGSNGLNGIFYSQTDNTHKTAVWNHGGGVALWNMTSAGSTVGGYQGLTAQLRDSSSWYHLVFVWDSGNATSGDRIITYKNGVRETAFADNVAPAQNQDSYINKAAAHQIGYYLAESGAQYNTECYFADYYFLDGQALDPSSFAKLDAVTNQWVPIEAKDDLTFGTNGFFLEFKNAAALGEDTSGNDNDFAVNSLGATDQMLDTPTLNWATWNGAQGLDSSGRVPSPLAEGNLKANQASDNAIATSSILMDSGKWYGEIYLNDKGGDGTFMWGFTSGDILLVYNSGQRKYDSGGETNNWAPTVSNGDILMLAMDTATGKVWYGVNNSWYNSGDPAAGTNEASTAPATEMPMGFKVSSNGSTSMASTINFGQDSSFAGAKTAQGNTDGNDVGDFYYTPPTGFLALCTANLPTPSIGKPGGHYNTTLYTGTGSELAVTGVGFQSDLTVIKNRSAADKPIWTDSIRGATNVITSINTAAQYSDAQTLKSWQSDGFTVGTEDAVNTNTEKFVSWNWKAGGTAVSNTDGTITSSVSANTTAGFSIVQYEGTEAVATVGHGLSQAPELILFKNIDSVLFWPVYNKTIDATDYLKFNEDNARADSADYFNDTEPTASVFSLGDKTECNRDTVISYCFHSVDGYSSVGVYAGNEISGGDKDGTFIYCGFRPAFVLVKNIDSAYFDTQACRWLVWDNDRAPSLTGPPGYNANTENTWWNEDSSEASSQGHDIDFLSNGFKQRSDGGSMNERTQNYIYYAVAGWPFKYANAR